MLVPNPLLVISRKNPCPFCTSGKKFKHCHMKKLPTLVSEELALENVEFMRKLKAVK